MIPSITLPTLTITPQPLTARVAIPAPALHALTLTDQGIYIEDHAGRWDYIPYNDLAALLDYGPDATVTLAPQPHTNGRV